MLDRFIVLETIGRGAQSHVYKVWDKKVHDIAAIKVVACTSDKQEIEQIKTIRLQQHLHHTSIVHVYDWLCVGATIIICMEYIKANVLMINKHPVQVEDSVVGDWMHQIIDVFIYLHQQYPEPVLYIDLKPQNILCDKDNRIYLFDFDSCVFQDIPYIRSATRGYAPKEVYEQQCACVQSDIYSFGICFYVLLHACFPMNHCPTHPYDRFLRKCYSSDIEERFDSFIQIKEVFTKIQKRKEI